MFGIEDSGDIILGDLSDLNTSTAHLVAVATDTGIPPRQVCFLNALTYNLFFNLKFKISGFRTSNHTFSRNNCSICWPNIY